MKKTLLRILSLTMCLLIVMPVGIAGVSAVEDKEYLYEDIFVEYLSSCSEVRIDGDGWYTYKELYYYYGEDKGGEIIPDKNAMPEYALVEARANIGGDAPCATVIDNYIIYSDMNYLPYSFSFHIYLPAENKIYTLEEAVLNEVEGIDRVFTEAGIGFRVGDTDKDREITIKDATKIQKCIAGLSNDFGYIDAFVWSENPPPFAISDFDRDCEVTIKDATAIQKHIAGLEY